MSNSQSVSTIGGKYIIEAEYTPPKTDYPTKFKLEEEEDYLRTHHLPFEIGKGGDRYYRPEIISRTHYQAETGKIPVSGAGYGGPFAGCGFDSVWFDMSEIVRPTRDGIHGREYISTQVYLGKKLRMLDFDEHGKLKHNPPKNVPIPFPVIFNPLPIPHEGSGADEAVAKAANELGTLAIVGEDDVTNEVRDCLPNLCVTVDKVTDKNEDLIKQAAAIQVRGVKGYQANIEKIREIRKDILVIAELEIDDRTLENCIKLFEYGTDAVHLRADHYAKGKQKKPEHIFKTVSRIHDRLVKEKKRHKSSIIVSGGVAEAEHVPKMLVAGADACGIDYILPVALGCCLWADTRYPCMYEHMETDPKWGARRIINLMCAWRNQLLEIMGAMGIREVRRLRGERGRIIYYEEEEAKFMKYLKAEGEVTYPRIDEAYAIGDCRWNPELIRATFEQARKGKPPTSEREYKRGRSGGGFDRLRFEFEDEEDEEYENKALKKIDLSVELNKRADGPRISIPYPIYLGGMSFGSTSLNVMLARAKAAKELGTFMSTGEGGYPEELIPYQDHIITQVATGLFGVSEETLKRSRIMEFKYAQGAKPGLGGHLLANKVTSTVARARESVVNRSLFSPFPFHSVYSVEDHKKHIDWIKSINPDILTIVKVSTPTDVDMVSVGSYFAGANIIDLDGSYGGTGAAPEISKKNIAMPIEYAIPKVHNFLQEEGIRDEVTLVASGGLRTAWDCAKAIALGADAVMMGTLDLVAIGCERLGRCEKGEGCPMGITTTKPELAKLIDPEWATGRIVNTHRSFETQLRYIVHRLGLKDIKSLRGKTKYLRYI